MQNYWWNLWQALSICIKIMEVVVKNTFFKSSWIKYSFHFSVVYIYYILFMISRCRSQHVVSVESSSLFHHSIYLWFICFPWWSIDELENLHVDRTTICLEPWQKPRARLGSHKTGLSTPPPSILILTVPMRYFYCGSLLLLVLAVRIYILVQLLC